MTLERGDAYILKKIDPFEWSDPQRRFINQARILSYLAQSGVPVAVPVLCDDGRVYTTDRDGHIYAVFPMLPNDSADTEPGPDLYHNIGAAIARLHLALAACPFGVESWTIAVDPVEQWVRRLLGSLPAAAGADLAPLVDRWWGAIARALAAPLQRVHGDVHGGNVLTDGERVTGIIDVDHLQLAPRCYDIAYWMAFAVEWRLTGHSALPFADEARGFLTGYGNVSPLPSQETEDIPALALVVALSLLAYFLRKEDLVKESWVRTAHWIDEHPDALRHPS